MFSLRKLSLHLNKMENPIDELLINVKTFQHYCEATRVIINEYKDTKVELNMTPLAKLRQFEIEYYDKCQENGAACIIYTRLLRLPESEAWSVMKMELIDTLHYWLQAIKQRLPKNHCFWWTFLMFILNTLNTMNLKHGTIPNMIMEVSGGILFDIATLEAWDAQQRHIVLSYLNKLSTDCTRAIRLALRKNFAGYFLKLAIQITSCGFHPLQEAALQTLVRWLVPRDQVSLRDASATRWFPPDRCPAPARQMFRKATWLNFFQDSRNFLNIINDGNKLVISVIMKMLFIGKKRVSNDKRLQKSWLDINTGLRSVSVSVDPCLVVGARADTGPNELLVIDSGSIHTATLYRNERQELRLRLVMERAPALQPSGLLLARAPVTFVLADCVLDRLHAALGHAFGDKYQNEVPSPAIPAEVTTQRSAGLHATVDPRRKSPSTVSTTSTTSLLQLRGKLTNLPQEPIFGPRHQVLRTEPELSIVAENSEYGMSVDERSPRAYGGSDISDADNIHATNNPENETKKICDVISKKAESDSEVYKQAQLATRRSVAFQNSSKFSELNIDNDNSLYDFIASCITKENFVGVKDIVAQVRDSRKRNGYSSDENKEIIENSLDSQKTLFENVTVRGGDVKKKCTVVSRSTTEDESNTEVIPDTPWYVQRRKPKQPEKNIAEEQTVGGFFLQSINRTKVQTLTKQSNPATIKNPSFTNTSDSCGENNFSMNEKPFNLFNQSEVQECVNNIVDKVCNVLEYQSAEDNYNKKGDTTNDKNTTPKKKLELKKKTILKTKNKNNKKGNKKNIEKVASRIDQIEEEIRATSPFKVQSANNSKNNNGEGSPPSDDLVIKRKRKLYSPNEYELNAMREECVSEDDSVVLADLKDKKNNKKPETRAACYKELAVTRKKRISLPRSRGTFRKSPSPSTVENDAIFDKLKANVDNNEKLRYGNKDAADIYNVISSGESDDFQINKMNLRKRAKSANAAQGTKSDKQKNTGKTSRKAKNVKPKPAKKTTGKRTYIESKEAINKLHEERMRDAGPNEMLNTSIGIIKPTAEEPTNVELVLANPPQIEAIPDERETVLNKVSKVKKNRKNTKPGLLPVKNKSTIVENNDSRSSSPFPELTVEVDAQRKEYSIELHIAEIGRLRQRLPVDHKHFTNNTDDTQMLHTYIEQSDNPQNNRLSTKDKNIFDKKEIETAHQNPRVVLKRHELTKETIITTKHDDKNITKEKVSINKDAIDILDKRSVSREQCQSIGEDMLEGHEDSLSISIGLKSPSSRPEIRMMCQPRRTCDTSSVSSGIQEAVNYIQANEERPNDIVTKQELRKGRGKSPVIAIDDARSSQSRRQSQNTPTTQLKHNHRSIFDSKKYAVEERKSISEASDARTAERDINKKDTVISRNSNRGNAKIMPEKDAEKINSNDDKVSPHKISRKRRRSLIMPVCTFSRPSPQGDDRTNQSPAEARESSVGISRVVTIPQRSPTLQLSVERSRPKSPSQVESLDFSMEAIPAKYAKLHAKTGRMLDEPPTSKSPVRRWDTTSRHYSDMNVNARVASKPSQSSIEDWFRRNETSALVSNNMADIKTLLGNLIKKLDSNMLISNNRSKKSEDLLNQATELLSQLKKIVEHDRMNNERRLISLKEEVKQILYHVEHMEEKQSFTH